MEPAIAYFGTPDFSAYLLEKLLKDNSIKNEIKLVVTQPDKPVGRKAVVTPSPVKLIAKKYNIVCIDDLATVAKYLKSLKCQLAILYAFGKIIPNDLLCICKYGFWNVHPSLLPKYRGPSPVAYTLLLGEKKTGVTVIKMDNLIDHGPILTQQKTYIFENETRNELTLRLTDIAHQILRKLLISIEKNGKQLQLKNQNHENATYTRLLKKSDGFIPLNVLKKALKNENLNENEIPIIIADYSKKNRISLNNLLKGKKSSEIIFNYFKGLFPWPGLWTLISIKGSEKRLKINSVSLSKKTNVPFLSVNKVQLEGKKEMNFADFCKIYPNFFA